MVPPRQPVHIRIPHAPVHVRKRIHLCNDREQPKQGGGKLHFEEIQKVDDPLFLDKRRHNQHQTFDATGNVRGKSRDGSIVHSGDNRTGEGDGDDESIQVNLEQLPAGVKHLVFTVNSFTGQNFEAVENAYCRIVDEVSGKEARNIRQNCTSGEKNRRSPYSSPSCTARAG